MKSFRKVLLIITVSHFCAYLLRVAKMQARARRTVKANKEVKAASKVADRAVKNRAALRLSLSTRRI